ncbi:MAG: hypothetical protein IPP45_14670 [Sphingomonadales bacterium]|nr:hypothetical protein [Sphingomonadales bacterium]
MKPGTIVTLGIDGRRFPMVAGSAGCASAQIRGPMQQSLLPCARPAAQAHFGDFRNGSRLVDAYMLKGAATAIDAAALGCARGR